MVPMPIVQAAEFLKRLCNRFTVSLGQDLVAVK
jgi:hypothetical protein